MRVLAIDGGGIRGLIPALVLAEIERRTGRRIGACFDLIAGTSTGGLIACALARPDPMPASQIARIYLDEGPQIFHRSLLKRITSVEGFLDERYDDDGLNASLARHLGETTLAEAAPDVFVAAYDIHDRFAFFFRSSRAKGDATYDFRLADAARATSAAPTYFEPAEVTDLAGARTYPLIDGGVFAVNPAMCAYAEVTAAGRTIELLASLGTGQHTRAYDAREVRGWGQLQWARPVLDMVFDGAADTVDFELASLMGAGYVRLQVELREAADDLDDASAGNLAALEREAARLIREQDARIDALCAQLAG
jgi:patatin-like phospholipase/acyl hydrolase